MRFSEEIREFVDLCQYDESFLADAGSACDEGERRMALTLPLCRN